MQQGGPIALNSQSPLVSVVIPVYNGAQYLSQAIDSVLAQGYGDIELIVVDDGSVDGTGKIARSYPGLRYRYQANSGVAEARNAGVRVAHGELVTFLDHDDLMVPDSVEVRVSHLVENPEIQCLIAMHDSFLDPGAVAADWVRPGEFDTSQFGFGYLMARKSFLDEVGGYDHGYRMLENIEMFFRAKDMGVRIEKLPKVVIRRRIHAHNASRDASSARLNLLRMAKASIERKRSSTD